MSTLQFIQTTPAELAELIHEGIKAQLQELRKELVNQSADDELMTREETCRFLSASAIGGTTNDLK